MSRPFFFKQFVIHQQHAPMKVGTDGVLIGAWAELPDRGAVLDIGSGTGLISLMVAQRSSESNIISVEPNTDALIDLHQNISMSKWKDRIAVFEGNLAQFEQTSPSPFESIISNPPYFIESQGASNSGRTEARHQNSLTSLNIVQFTQKFLSQSGSLHVIFPSDQKMKWIHEAKTCGLSPARICNIKPTKDIEAKRTMISFVKTKPTPIEESLFIEVSRHVYSPEYTELTKAFYLKM